MRLFYCYNIKYSMLHWQKPRYVTLKSDTTRFTARNFRTIWSKTAGVMFWPILYA